MAELKKLVSMDSEVMSDETFETMLEALQQSADSTDVNELLSKSTLSISETNEGQSRSCTI